MSPDRFDALDRLAPLLKAPEPSFERFLRRRDRRQRIQRLSAAIVGIAVFVAAIWLVTSGTRTGQNGTMPADESPTVVPESPLGQPFVLDLGTRERKPLPEALVPQTDPLGVYINYSVSPDGTKLAYGTCLYGSCSGSDVMGVGDVDGTDARILDVPRGLNGYLPRWSPDGTKLVYQRRPGGSFLVGNLFLYDLSTGQGSPLTDLELTESEWWFLDGSFSPDGRSVIFHLPHTGDDWRWDVWSVPVTGGEPTVLLRDAAFPAYFPDGSRIAFVEPGVSPPGGVSLEIAEAVGSRRTLVHAKSISGIWWPAVSPDGTRIAYRDGRSIYLVDVSTGESATVAHGENATWLDNDSLIVAPRVGRQP